MHPGRLIYVLLAAGLVVLAGVVGALALGFGPVMPNDPPNQATLTSFTSTGGTCVENREQTTDSKMQSEHGVTFLSIDAVVIVPATNDGLDSSLERNGPAEYTLNVTSSEVAGKPSQDCDGTAQANFTASVRLPHAADESFTVVVEHDGEVIDRIHNR